MGATEQESRTAGEKKVQIKMENVAVSSRVRLARNIEGYPFPNRLDEAKASEIVMLVSEALAQIESFKRYDMRSFPEDLAERLMERNFISQALIRNRRISAAFISDDDESPLHSLISVMVNEEDHIRAQCIVPGFDLKKPYERLVAVDDTMAETIPIAFDAELGYLTACPTNLGTGLRASVLLFLPALTRRGRMPHVQAVLRTKGLTVRGALGEGSGSEGELYQISNEVTLGLSESFIINAVESMVQNIVEMELVERRNMCRENGIHLYDSILRSYGILCNCLRIDEQEFHLRMADIKLGVALGILEGSMAELDDLIVGLRPATIDVAIRGGGADARDAYRAEYAGRVIRKMNLLTESARNRLLKGE